MGTYSYGHGTPPCPQPDDTGLVWAVHIDGRALAAEPADTEYMPPMEKLRQIKDKLAG